MYTMVDFCAGIGGFRLGFEQVGYKCVYSCEKDEIARSIYERNFKEKPQGVDMTKIDENEVPYADVFVAGIPCQSFSRAGKMRGFEDSRGTLFFDVLRIVKKMKPKVILLENVKMLYTHDKGKTYNTMRTLLEKEGYNVSEKVLNSRDFGLAQSRERLFIIAMRKDLGIFDFSTLKNSTNVVIKDILIEEGNYIDESKYVILNEKDIKKQASGIEFVGYIKAKSLRGKGVDQTKLYQSRVHRQHNRIYGVNGTLCTIMSQEQSGRYWVYDGKGVRKLTKEELKMLMGYSKDFYLPETSFFYKCLGNSVCIPIVKEIAESLKGYI